MFVPLGGGAFESGFAIIYSHQRIHHQSTNSDIATFGSRASLRSQKSPSKNYQPISRPCHSLLNTMLPCRPVNHIQPYKTMGAQYESFAQSMAQPLPPISQVLGEVHPPTYSRSTVPAPPTITANPPTRHTTAFVLSSAPQTFDLQSALEVVRYPQTSRRTTLHTNNT